MLEVNALSAGYGERQVLHGVSLRVGGGEIVAVIGHNGAGKSTLLKAIVGLAASWSGEVLLDGKLVRFQPAEARKRGVAYIPQGGRIFPDLTVHENLVMGISTATAKGVRTRQLASAYSMFPILDERRRQPALLLSGGEKQMLALATALVSNPVVLLVDEPSLGLSLARAREVLAALRLLAKDRGLAVVVVEQRVRDVLKIADRVFALRQGRVSFNGPADELQDDVKLREVYL